MTSSTGKPPPIAVRKLASAADLAGNADGVASKSEVESIATESCVRPSGKDPINPASEQKQAAKKLLGKPDDETVRTLEPALQALPAPLRRLALEIDGLWGNADGKVSVQELDRVATYYLAALPFFVPEAEAILELAEHLGYGTYDASSATLWDLRAALKKVDPADQTAGAPFRALFDEALGEADVPGVPELLREAVEHAPQWHSLSVLEHTAVAVTAIRSLAESVDLEWKDAGAVMLLHDVGKVLKRDLIGYDDETFYTFREHESVGADWLAARGLDPEIVFHIRNHAKLREMTEAALMDACGHDKGRLAQVLVVYVADQVAKGVRTAQLSVFAEQTPKIRKLCEVAGIDPDVLLLERVELIDRWFGETVPP